jgi:hypothetical protein
MSDPVEKRVKLSSEPDEALSRHARIKQLTARICALPIEWQLVVLDAAEVGETVFFASVVLLTVQKAGMLAVGPFHMISVDIGDLDDVTRLAVERLCDTYDSRGPLPPRKVRVTFTGFSRSLHSDEVKELESIVVALGGERMNDCFSLCCLDHCFIRNGCSKTKCWDDLVCGRAGTVTDIQICAGVCMCKSGECCIFACMS